MSSAPINPRDLTAGVTFTALDITERKRAETELRRSHQTFLTVLDGIDATVYVADIHSHEILFMNKHMIDAFGGDFSGGLCHEAFRGETAPCENCTNDRLLDADGQPHGCVCLGDKEPAHRKMVHQPRQGHPVVGWANGKVADCLRRYP
jgi:PAS domain-containing protein